MAYIHEIDEIVSNLLHEVKSRINFAEMHYKDKRLGDFIVAYSSAISANTILRQIKQYVSFNDIKLAKDNEMELTKQSFRYKTIYKLLDEKFIEISQCEI